MGQEGAGRKKLSELLSSQWVLIFILFLAILAIYYKTLYFPFINFDDTDYIIDNSFIRDLSWKGFYEIFSQPIYGNYFPLQILSYAFDYQLWYIRPFGYHLHNIVLHILNAVLVFILLKKIFSNTWISFLSALLFGLHPVNVESVTWVSERKNVLFLVFTVLSLLAYLSYLGEERLFRRRAWYSMSMLFFSLALLSKVAAVVLPLLLLLYDFCFPRRRTWEMVRDKIPFFLLSFLFSLITVWVYHSLGELSRFHGESPYRTFLAMINVFVEYIIYLFVPVYLDHCYSTPIPQTIFERQVLLSLGAIFLLALLAWRSLRRDRLLFFWFGWFAISLLPVLNIVPIAILRADRYMYLPAIGFFYLISLQLWKISQVSSPSYRRPAFIFGAFLITGALAFLTIERNQVWKDYITLWEDNLKKFPQSPIPYKNLGEIHTQQGKLDLAILYFQTGLKENPDAVPLINDLAVAYKNKGDLKRAEELLLQGNRINPKDSYICSNLGLIYLDKGDMEKAEDYTKRAIDLNSQSAAAHTNLGVIYFRQNRWDEAIRELEKAIQISPSAINSYLTLSVIYYLRGSQGKPEFYLKQGLEYFPSSHEALLMLGRIYFEQGKIQEARYYITRAYRLKPKDETTKYFLNLIAQREAGSAALPAMVGFPPIQAQTVESSMDKKKARRSP